VTAESSEVRPAVVAAPTTYKRVEIKEPLKLAVDTSFEEKTFS
jgi:hypothetical protein